VTLRAADPAWMRRLVLGLGPAAEVVGPAWLVEQVRAEATEALAAYG
jgi:proteasome accessory factor C